MPITPSIWIRFYFSSPQHAWNVDRQIFALAGWFCQARFQAVTPKQAPALLWFNMNVKSWGGKKRLQSSGLPEAHQLPTLIKDLWVVLQWEKTRKTRNHIWGQCGGMSFLSVCVCVQALDLCHIIKILLSIKVEKVKWPSASEYHQNN